MEGVLRTPKRLLKTSDAIYPVMAETFDNERRCIRTATAFAAVLPRNSPAELNRRVLILAINPSGNAEQNVNFFTLLQNRDRLNFREHAASMLVAKPSNFQSSSIYLRKVLKFEDFTAGPNNLASVEGVLKIYVTKTSGSRPKKYMVKKDDDGKYRLVNGTLGNAVLPLGAPVVKCYKGRSRLFSKSSKKVIGMVKSAENGALGVLHFTGELVQIIRNGGQLMDTIDAPFSVCEPPMAPTNAQHLTSNLSRPTRDKICKKLNAPRPFGGDYKTFAGLIEMPNVNIQRLEIPGIPNQTSKILEWWGPNPNATISNFRQLLLAEDMKRYDVVKILDERPQTGAARAVASETGDQTNESCTSSTSTTQFVSDLYGPTKEAICNKLNVPKPFGGDYKTLAGLVGMSNDEIRSLDTARHVNPMDEVLIWWEREPERATILEFRRLLLVPEMRRQDVVEILDSLPETGAAQAVASESSDQDNGSSQVATPETGNPDVDNP